MRILSDGYVFTAADSGEYFFYEGSDNIFALLPNGHVAPDMEVGWEVHILQGNNSGKIKIECQSGIDLLTQGGSGNNFTKGRGAKASIQLVKLGSLYLMNGNNGDK
jgi:hypothetical protein